jgi:hypothetical protein
MPPQNPSSQGIRRKHRCLRSRFSARTPERFSIRHLLPLGPWFDPGFWHQKYGGKVVDQQDATYTSPSCFTTHGKKIQNAKIKDPWSKMCSWVLHRCTTCMLFNHFIISDIGWPHGTAVVEITCILSTATTFHTEMRSRCIPIQLYCLSRAVSPILLKAFSP